MSDSKSTLSIALDHIHETTTKLFCDWRIISLLVRIEKFDAHWPSLAKTELIVFDACPDIISYEKFLEDVKYIISSTPTDCVVNLEAIKFWFETELEIHPLISCLLFGYFMQHLLAAATNYLDLSIQAIVVSLFKSGYIWIKHISLPLVNSSEIGDWLVSFLTFIRDGQLSLLHKLDIYGVKNKLTLKEQMLLHIIENNDGIKTTAIARKLGLSRATVKRMLNVFKEKRIIELKGVNRATYYKAL